MDTIRVALQGLDTTAALHHEAIHSLRGGNLFTPGWWATLNRRAFAEWRAEFDIDGRCADLDEEAVAEAFAAFMRGDLASKCLVTRGAVKPLATARPYLPHSKFENFATDDVKEMAASDIPLLSGIRPS